MYGVMKNKIIIKMGGGVFKDKSDLTFLPIHLFVFIQ